MWSHLRQGRYCRLSVFVWICPYPHLVAHLFGPAPDLVIRFPECIWAYLLPWPLFSHHDKDVGRHFEVRNATVRRIRHHRKHARRAVLQKTSRKLCRLAPDKLCRPVTVIRTNVGRRALRAKASGESVLRHHIHVLRAPGETSPHVLGQHVAHSRRMAELSVMERKFATWICVAAEFAAGAILKQGEILGMAGAKAVGIAE